MCEATPPRAQTEVNDTCATESATASASSVPVGSGLWLVGVDARKNPIRLPFDREAIVVGGDGQCDLPLVADPYVSRRHARITRDRGMVLVEDLASSNGTFVRIRRAIVLEPGDELLIGTTVLRLEHVQS